MNGSEKLGEIFDQNPYMVVIVVDKNNLVIYINKTYLRILNLPAEKVLGKSVLSITPATRSV